MPTEGEETEIKPVSDRIVSSFPGRIDCHVDCDLNVRFQGTDSAQLKKQNSWVRNTLNAYFLLT